MTELFQPAVWTWYADPRAVRDGDLTYVLFHADAGVYVGAYDEQDETWETFRLGDTDVDDHNVGAVGIRTDGRVIAAWRHRSPDGITLRISDAPGDISSWGPEKDICVGACSYPSLMYLSSEDRWYLFYRHSAGTASRSMWLSTSDDQGGNWSTPQKIFEVTDSRPYHKFATNGVDRIDAITTDGHPINWPDNSVYHYYYESGTWRDSAGTDIGSPPFGTSDVTKIYDGATNDPAWTWDVSPGPNPVALFATFPTTSDHRYQWARWNGASWDIAEIATAGGSIAPGTVEEWYSGGLAVDHANPANVYASVEDADGWTLRHLDVDINGTVLGSQDLATAQAGEKNIRPVVARGDGRVLWVSGRYDHFRDFDTRLRASPALLLPVDPEPEPPPEPGITLPAGTVSPVIQWLGCDLVTGRIIADLPDITGRLSRILGEYTTTGLTLPIPLSGRAAIGDLAFQATTPGRTMIVPVVNDQPAWGGMVTRRNGGAGATLALSCTTLEGYLARRRVRNHTYTQTDQATIAAGLVADAGTILGVGPGISLEIDAPPSEVLRDREYKATDRGTVYKRLQELAGVTGGIEWTIELLWGDDTQTWVRKVLRIRNRIGVAAAEPQAVFQTTAAGVFESQGGNEATYDYDEDFSDGRGANYVVAYSSGQGEDQPASAPAIDTPALAAGFPIYENHWQPSSSIRDTDVLNDHAQRRLQLMRHGANTWSIAARWNVYPRLNIDWRLGDDVGWQLVGHRHPGGVIGQGRCIGWDLDPEAGTVQPILLDPSSDEGDNG